MKIIIVGAGRIGINLARSLSEENHEIYLIEKDQEVALKATEKLDIKVICGNGSDPESLKQAGVDQADLVIAVTISDEVNMIVCSLASFFGSKRQIARVRDGALSGTIKSSEYQHFHIDEIINPEQLAALSIVRAVDAPGSCEVGDFADGKILLRAFEVPEGSHLCDAKIGEFSDEDFPWPFLVVTIVRDGTVLIPKGDTLIAALDRIYVLLPAQSLGEFLTFVDPSIKKPNKIVIYGATNAGEYVAESLSDHVRDLILVEENKAKAEIIAQHLPSVRVINGSASEKDILQECGIEAVDIFIGTANSDHSNLISAVLAKKMGAKNTIIVTQRPDYTSIVDALDIDAVINPHLLAVEQILRLVRGKGVSAVTKLLECKAEVLEFIPEEGSPVTKALIKDINFPKSAIVGAISREDDVILAKGDTQINAGEKVIVFCEEGSVKKLQSLFTLKGILK
ncbi:MAG: Trk system potassium transporter TrkA [Candidatus Zapsychrus exili]|nr:Trk system potassium transporter TrkA [Candidatus Zapsychrus exili]